MLLRETEEQPRGETDAGSAGLARPPTRPPANGESPVAASLRLARLRAPSFAAFVAGCPTVRRAGPSEAARAPDDTTKLEHDTVRLLLLVIALPGEKSPSPLPQQPQVERQERLDCKRGAHYRDSKAHAQRKARGFSRISSVCNRRLSEDVFGWFTCVSHLLLSP